MFILPLMLRGKTGRKEMFILFLMLWGKEGRQEMFILPLMLRERKEGRKCLYCL